MIRQKNRSLRKFICPIGRNRKLFTSQINKNNFGIFREYLLISDNIWNKLDILKETSLMSLLKLANTPNKQVLMPMNCEGLLLKSSLNNYGYKVKLYSF
jgi:hypothetical protein